jgi:hypothetical protein
VVIVITFTGWGKGQASIPAKIGWEIRKVASGNQIEAAVGCPGENRNGKRAIEQ